MSRRPALAIVAAVTLATGLLGCSDGGTEPPRRTPSTPAASSASAGPTDLTLGVYGTEQELEAWEGVVGAFNSASETGEVRLVRWQDRDEAVEAIRDGGVPDVFMSSRQELDHLLEEGLTRPVSELLDERGVDFGDGFSRDAVQSFGVADELQCMAYSVSPMVMYYNTDLVDFERMERRGLDVPARWRWSLAQFTAAAEFAARPARGTSGFHVDPTIQGLAPFIHSGGGSVFDDPETPTSLSFSSDDTRGALEEALAVLRDASLTLTDEQLERRTPLEWFKRGKLGMLPGYRSLTPELRMEQQLAFDVMPMPSLGSGVTVGDVTGLCLSAETEDAAAAADLIAFAVSDVAVERVTRAGAMVPANLSVASSDVFLQEGRQPERAGVFNAAVRGMVIPPLLDSWVELEEAVAPYLTELLWSPGELDLEAVTTEIDEASREVLEPEVIDESAESESPGE